MKRTGFTLTELLVVIAIIATLSTLSASFAHSARESAKSAACQANLRQLAQATLAYVDAHRGTFPWAYKSQDGYTMYCWDYVTRTSGETEPGPIWNGCADRKVLGCPSCAGWKDDWTGEKFTGYNYNCSFIGKVEGDPAYRTAPRKISTLHHADRVALFGDGEYADGPNKFMRAPRSDSDFDESGSGIREAGTQGFRHKGRTNVVFCDGHVESLSQSYTLDGTPGFVAKSCGFISPDNSLYGGEED